MALHRAVMSGEIPAQIACVISNRAGAGGLEYAREHGIPTHVIPDTVQADEKQLTEWLLAVLQRYDARLVVLAGFLKKIPAPVVEAYSNRIINIHPALLPAFGGKGMYGRHVHEAVLAYGCKVTGATVHIVTTEYDAGPPVLQKCVPVFPDDTPDTLAARVLKVEHELLPQAVALFARGLIRVEGRKVIIVHNSMEQPL